MTLQQIKRSVGFPAPNYLPFGVTVYRREFGRYDTLRCACEKKYVCQIGSGSPPILMGVNNKQLICLEFICLQHARHRKMR